MENFRFKDYLKDYLEHINITNKEFATRIGISQKHLNDILKGDADLSAKVINNISIITGIPVDYIKRIEFDFYFNKIIDDFLNKEKITINDYFNRFPYKYLKDNKWISFRDPKDKREIIKDILRFLRISDPEQLRKNIDVAFYKSKNENIELLALWLEKCFRETDNQVVDQYNKKNIDKLVTYIRKEAIEERFVKDNLIKTFNENGIYLVIMDDIPGSKIRGSFKVLKDKPAIYLTTKHKRIADIYFALLHELAHCKSDFNKAKQVNLVSFMSGEDINEIEKKADIQAFNWMVPEIDYKKIKKNYHEELEKTSYPRSFLVYRLAKDGVIKYGSSTYQKYNKLINI